MNQKTFKVLGLFFVSLSVLLLSFPVAAQQPGLIDRELLFGDPEVSAAQISPDGKSVAFLKPLNQTRNIWVKKTGEPFSAAKPITGETTRPIPSYFWSRDSRYILFVQDQAGDENYNVYAVNPAEPPAMGSEVPPARNLTAAKGVKAVIYAVPRALPGKYALRGGNPTEGNYCRSQNGCRFFIRTQFQRNAKSRFRQCG